MWSGAGDGERLDVAAGGGPKVVRTARCIRYVYPARGTKFRRGPPFMRASRTGYDLRKLRICMIVGTTVAGGTKFESYPVKPVLPT